MFSITGHSPHSMRLNVSRALKLPVAVHQNSRGADAGRAVPSMENLMAVATRTPPNSVLPVTRSRERHHMRRAAIDGRAHPVKTDQPFSSTVPGVGHIAMRVRRCCMSK